MYRPPVYPYMVQNHLKIDNSKNNARAKRNDVNVRNEHGMKVGRITTMMID